jgi:hypothetical protein
MNAAGRRERTPRDNTDRPDGDLNVAKPGNSPANRAEDVAILPRATRAGRGCARDDLNLLPNFVAVVLPRE